MFYGRGIGLVNGTGVPCPTRAKSRTWKKVPIVLVMRGKLMIHLVLKGKFVIQYMIQYLILTFTQAIKDAAT